METFDHLKTGSAQAPDISDRERLRDYAKRDVEIMRELMASDPHLQAIGASSSGTFATTDRAARALEFAARVSYAGTAHDGLRSLANEYIRLREIFHQLDARLKTAPISGASAGHVALEVKSYVGMPKRYRVALEAESFGGMGGTIVSGLDDDLTVAIEKMLYGDTGLLPVTKTAPILAAFGAGAGFLPPFAGEADPTHGADEAIAQIDQTLAALGGPVTPATEPPPPATLLDEIPSEAINRIIPTIDAAVYDCDPTAIAIRAIVVYLDQCHAENKRQNERHDREIAELEAKAEQARLACATMNIGNGLARP